MVKQIYVLLNGDDVMNKLIFLPLFLLLWSASLFAAGDQYVLGVDGLGCPFCAYGVEKKLSTINGVENVETDIESGQITVTLTEGKALSEEAAREAVKDAGFSLRSFTRNQEIE